MAEGVTLWGRREPTVEGGGEIEKEVVQVLLCL